MISVLLLSSAAWAPASTHQFSGVTRMRGVCRVVAPRAETPFRSDDEYDYFRKSKMYTVTLEKPLGAVLEECAPAGVRVEALQEGGSAASTGLLKKGDRLRTIQGTDVSKASFDDVSHPLLLKLPSVCTCMRIPYHVPPVRLRRL